MTHLKAVLATAAIVAGVVVYQDPNLQQSLKDKAHDLQESEKSPSGSALLVACVGGVLFRVWGRRVARGTLRTVFGHPIRPQIQTLANSLTDQAGSWTPPWQGAEHLISNGEISMTYYPTNNRGDQMGLKVGNLNVSLNKSEDRLLAKHFATRMRNEQSKVLATQLDAGTAALQRALGTSNHG